jgi:hypothetical protein
VDQRSKEISTLKEYEEGSILGAICISILGLNKGPEDKVFEIVGASELDVSILTSKFASKPRRKIPSSLVMKLRNVCNSNILRINFI